MECESAGYSGHIVDAFTSWSLGTHDSIITFFAGTHDAQAHHCIREGRRLAVFGNSGGGIVTLTLASRWRPSASESCGAVDALDDAGVARVWPRPGSGVRRRRLALALWHLEPWRARPRQVAAANRMAESVLIDFIHFVLFFIFCCFNSKFLVQENLDNITYNRTPARRQGIFFLTTRGAGQPRMRLPSVRKMPWKVHLQRLGVGGLGQRFFLRNFASLTSRKSDWLKLIIPSSLSLVSYGRPSFSKRFLRSTYAPCPS